MENELLNQIKDEVGAYGQSLTNVGKLRLVGIVSRILGLFLLILTLVLLVFAVFSFGAVALIDALANHMPVWAAALIIGGLYVVLIVIAVACRKPLFVHPFISLMMKQIHSEEELALKTIEAENEAKLQRMRMECNIENATRELSLFVSIIDRLRKFLFRKNK